MRARLAGLTLTRLRLWLALFFLALALPTAVLVVQAYSQLKWESFHQAQTQAEELARRIEREFARRVAEEERRGYADYEFLVVSGDPANNFLRPSEISGLPATRDLPGLVGYFQVGSDGVFSTPLLPQSGIDAGAWGIGAADLAQRQALAGQLRAILQDNRLVRTPVRDIVQPTRARRDKDTVTGGSDVSDSSRESLAAGSGASADEEAEVLQEKSKSAPSLFDQLSSISSSSEAKQQADNLGRVEDLKLEQRYQQAPPAAAPKEREVDDRQLRKRASRKELANLPEAQEPLPATAAAPAPLISRQSAEANTPLRIQTFESEIDPFEFSRLNSGQFVLYRTVWRAGRRETQGMILEAQAWLRGLAESTYRESALAQSTDLVVAYRGDVLALFASQAQRSYLASADELRGALLYQSRLGAPLSDLELIFSVQHLPAGPGATVVTWLAVILALVLSGGFVLLERLAASQIHLARQQQDFVSAVSHELKTPLTSIRMYGEMLREGWATEEKKRSYYDYIHDESERLSRLINNVLQLARLTRNDLQMDLKPVRVETLLDAIRSRVDAQVSAAGFTLEIDCGEAAGSLLELDVDFFTQIVINLVDNALKFSARSERRQIDLRCARRSDERIEFSVRDYGPGLPRDQMKKVFTLFYRMENELTRETVGTGIGLALVHQLTVAMGGSVDVRNREPGAEFRVTFSAGGGP